MQRWKQEFVGSGHRKCVQINRNGVFDQGKVLYIEPDWSFLDLLHAASQRLDIIPSAEKIYNADGVEVDDCMMVIDDDILFFSKDEEFIPPDSIATESPEKGRNEGERLPNSVGGYKVGDLLGRGGFGEVRCGDHQLTGEKVALKFLRKAEIHSLGAAERTNTEIQCLATLKHHNIIKLIQHLETASHVVLVFELMAGGDLLKFLLQRGGLNASNGSVKAPAPPFTNQASSEDLTGTGLSERAVSTNRCVLTEDEARHTFYQVLCAISYAHNQHICHRDLKLENILLKDSTLSLVKIADFGLSDFYRPGATMKSSCGTLSFLAPEVFKGTSNAGPPLDVWSMGVILFAILCGRLPFEGPDLVGTKRPREQIIKSRIMKSQYKIDDNLGPEAKDLVRRMLQIDPVERASIPEIFNHVWVRPAVSGNVSDQFHLQSLAAANANANANASLVTKSNPEAGNIYSGAGAAAIARRNSGATLPIFREDPSSPQLERGESIPPRGSRHRTSQSMNGIPTGVTPSSGGGTLSRSNSSRTLLFSTSDLQELEEEAKLSAQSSPRGQTTPQGEQSGSSRISSARLLFSPQKDALLDSKQGSFNGIDFSGIADPVTPRGNLAFSPGPLIPQIEEHSPTPSAGAPNKAFKLIPLRKQLTSDNLNSPSEQVSSPSTKLRSNSTSEALNAAGVAQISRSSVPRRSGVFDDDEDDSYTSSNWRNITLDPSPSTPALAPSTGSRKTASSGTTSAKISTGGRREALSQSRASSSSSLTANTPQPSTKERTASSTSSSAAPSAVARGASAAALNSAVAAMNITGSPREEPHYVPSKSPAQTGLHTGIASVQSDYADRPRRTNHV